MARKNMSRNQINKSSHGRTSKQRGVGDKKQDSKNVIRSSKKRIRKYAVQNMANRYISEMKLCITVKT